MVIREGHDVLSFEVATNQSPAETTTTSSEVTRNRIHPRLSSDYVDGLMFQGPPPLLPPIPSRPPPFFSRSQSFIPAQLPPHLFAAANRGTAIRSPPGPRFVGPLHSPVLATNTTTTEQTSIHSGSLERTSSNDPLHTAPEFPITTSSNNRFTRTTSSTPLGDPGIGRRRRGRPPLRRRAVTSRSSISTSSASAPTPAASNADSIIIPNTTIENNAFCDEIEDDEDSIRRQRNREYARQSRERKRKEVQSLLEFGSSLREALSIAERQINILQEGCTKARQDLQIARQAHYFSQQEHRRLSECLARHEHQSKRLRAWIDVYLTQGGYPPPPPPPPS
mmetsp:Transcript_14868/g.22380  ORF Transcript_14868/g.22380 Transcript_14868/m.22380 type:complete len:336 (-) Transcript_14868:81-1088(-)